MTNILFMNDTPMYVVDGDVERRAHIRALKQKEYWDKHRGYGVFDSKEEYLECCFWHYHDVERIREDG